MTNSSDEDFSLKEWVMKRAANQMGEGYAASGRSTERQDTPKGERIEQVDFTDRSRNDEIRILGSKAGSYEQKTPDKFAEKSPEKFPEKSQEKSKMTRFSNGVAPAVNANGSNGTHVNGANGHTNGHANGHANGHSNGHSAVAAAAAAAKVLAPNGQAAASPAQAVQQLQIVRLLQDLGERLRQSEKEREILWKELDGCRKLLTDIEDKTSKTEKAYLTLEHKVSAKQSEGSDAAQKEALEKLSKTLQEKIESIETTAGSAILRIEDAINENTKLARRLDQVTQDKARLLRKLDTMEETLTQTQDALKAKALVLLTDQALASRTNLPQTPAWSGNDTLRVAAPQPAAQAQTAKAGAIDPLIDEGSLFRRSGRIKISTPLLVSLVTLGVGAGWGLSQMQMPDIGLGGAAVQSSEVTSDGKSQEQLMADIARMANDVEPGAATEEIALQPKLKPDEILAQQAEKAAIATFQGDAPEGDVADRIERDAALPKEVRDIEKRALEGDGEAQHDLAAIYTAGHAGVKTNYAKAAEWFNEAAHNNVANAQYNLAVLYHQGLGVKQDTRKAIQLYRVAASNKHPEAEYNLGIAHIEGVGADYSPRVAAKYFEHAAAGGIVEAAYNLGLIEENGLLGDARPDEAVFWYKTAADEGNGQAKQALESLQKQRKLSDQDIARIHNRIAVLKPNAFNPKELTEMNSQVNSDANSDANPDAGAGVNGGAEAAPAKKSSDDRADAGDATTAGKPRYESVIVTQIQEQLAQMGLYSGEADGNINAATEEAVKSYQAMNKLKADGKPTEDVLVHMLANDVMGLTPSGGAAN